VSTQIVDDLGILIVIVKTGEVELVVDGIVSRRGGSVSPGSIGWSVMRNPVCLCCYLDWTLSLSNPSLFVPPPPSGGVWAQYWNLSTGEVSLEAYVCSSLMILHGLPVPHLMLINSGICSLSHPDQSIPDSDLGCNMHHGFRVDIMAVRWSEIGPKQESGRAGGRWGGAEVKLVRFAGPFPLLPSNVRFQCVTGCTKEMTTAMTSVF